MKRLFLILMLPAIVSGLSAENISERKMRSDLLINLVLPGYWQISRGNTAEGIMYMSSVPLYLAANYLFLDFYLPVISDQSTLYRVENNDHYLFYSDSVWSRNDRWKLYTGLLIGAASTLLSTYSSYAAEEEYNAAVDGKYTEKYGEALEFRTVLSAPWSPENILNLDFFPAYPMFALLGTEPDDYRRLTAYFARDSVPFLGLEVHPVAGAALALGSSLLLANMSTLSEEMIFRGHLLREKGIHVSSLIFGPLHLGNMLIPNTSVESTVLQSLFATLFGYYAGYRTEQNGYDFRRMIALHFWHNVTVMTLSYMINPEQTMSFSIGSQLFYN